MSRRQHLCPSCGEPVPSLWGSIIHCDAFELEDDPTYELGYD